MEKSDSFAFGPHPWGLVDQTDPCAATPLQCSVQIINGEADVVYAGTAFGDELCDWRIGGFRLEQLHQRVSGTKPSDASSVGVFERLTRQPEQVAIQRKGPVESVDGNA